MNSLVTGYSTAMRIPSVAMQLIVVGMLALFSSSGHALPIGYLLDAKQIEEINRNLREKVEKDARREEQLRRNAVSRESRVIGNVDSTEANRMPILPSIEAGNRPLQKK